MRGSQLQEAPTSSFQLCTFKISLKYNCNVLLKFQLVITSLLHGEIHQWPALSDIPSFDYENVLGNSNMWLATKGGLGSLNYKRSLQREV